MMLEGIIAGVMANAITNVLAKTGDLLCNSQIKPEELSSYHEKNICLDCVAKECKSHFEKRKFYTQNEISENIKSFIKSTEMLEVIEKVAVLKITGRDDDIKLKDDVIDCYMLALQNYINITVSDNEGQYLALFDYIYDNCLDIIDSCIADGHLMSHENMSRARYNHLLDVIYDIRKKIEYLEQDKPIKLKSVERYERNISSCIHERFSTISPPFVDKTIKIAIDDIYVEPDFKSVKSDIYKKGDIIDFKKFTSGILRTVVLGNPGAGKTTLTHRICNTLTTKSNLKSKKIIPFYVLLREYSQERKTRGTSFVDYLENKSNTAYHIKPPKNCIEYILHSGRGLVIFDGLDELIDTNQKKEIVSDIEVFSKRFSPCQILITSRIVGYYQSPLNHNKFSVFEINDFNDDQIEEYVDKWFRSTSDADDSETTKHINDFLTGSNKVNDLKSNPLILSLMCNFYKGERYIPENRPDVYHKCATMLYNKRDERKGIQNSLPFKSHTKRTVMHLAHWLYTEKSGKEGVAENKLIKETSKYLNQNLYDDYESAEEAAEEFVNYCKGRAWVFTDIGQDKNGENLYHFTHRTFLEYFTALYLCRKTETKEELADILKPKIESQEWDTVAELAFQIKDEETDTAGDYLLNYLIDNQSTDETKQSASIMFCANCLEFLVPTPETRRKIAKNSIRETLKASSSSDIKDRNNRVLFKTLPLNLVNSLLNSRTENIPTIISTIYIELNRLAKSKDQNIKENSIRIAFLTTKQSYQMQQTRKETIDLCEQNLSELIQQNLHDVQKLASKHIEIRNKLAISHIIPMSEYIDRFGLQALFEEEFVYPFGGVELPIIFHIIDPILEYPYTHVFDDSISSLLEMAIEAAKAIVEKSNTGPTPVIISNDLHALMTHDSITYAGKQINNPKTITSNKEYLFSIFVLIALAVEPISKSNLLISISRSNNAIMKKILPILSKRLQNRTDQTNINTFSNNNNEWAKSWCSRKINIIMQVHDEMESDDSYESEHIDLIQEKELLKDKEEQPLDTDNDLIILDSLDDQRDEIPYRELPTATED